MEVMIDGNNQRTACSPVCSIEPSSQPTTNDDSLLASLRNHILEGRVVNEVIELMLKIKVTSLSQSQELEDEDTLSQQLFWDEASKCLGEIEKTMKARQVYEAIPDRDNIDGLSFNMGMQGNSLDAQLMETTTPLAGVSQMAQKKNVQEVFDIPSFTLGILGINPEFQGITITLPPASAKNVSKHYKRKAKELKVNKDGNVSKDNIQSKDGNEV
ncbi:hypothetical protein V2J09_003697 [Rumex salicifolius]